MNQPVGQTYMPVMDANDSDFEQMHRKWYPGMVRFASCYLLDEELAENAAQDIFLKLYERRDVIPYQGRLGAWLFTISKNKCLDVLRKRKAARLKYVDLDESKLKQLALEQFDGQELSDMDKEEIAKEAIASLPDRCREIFVMCRVDGLSHKEVSEKLGISTNTVESQMTIAIRKLKAFLKDCLPSSCSSVPSSLACFC